jgi:predicted AlkP superfamily pyrophosphatase or phosphodiesterase
MILLLAAVLTQDVEHVVIVSIDGFRPEFYRGDYETPALKALAREGASADEVEGVYPSTTYPSHATIVTGVRPWKHGVAANTTWGAGGSTRDWHWEARHLKARTLWQAAREKGLKVAITYWPTAVGAEADWVLGEIWDPEGKATLDRWRRAATPGLLEELCAATAIPEAEIARDKASIDRFVAQAAAHVFRTRKPNLQLVHLLCVDDVQHKEGRDAAAVRAVVREHDGYVARLREAVAASGVGDKTLFIVLGDHGFVDVRRNINPNALLRDEGWLTAREGRVETWTVLGRSSGGSMAIYVKKPGDVPAIRDLFRAKAAGMYEVLERDALDRLGYDPQAALALEPRDDWAFSGALTEKFVEGVPTVKGNHGQRPSRPGLATGFVAAGPGVKAGASIPKMRLVDVAPTVAKALKLSMPDVEGTAVDLGR